ncbi:cytochrome P450 [Nitriliruptoraceae bacterium ZYF776]|nr:cytochrome P450 [Profundirhabdus halotolerans]
MVGVRVPGPSGVAAVRATLGLQRDPLGTVRDLRARYGDTIGVRLPGWLPGVPPLLVQATEPKLVRETLTDTSRFVKGSPVYREMADALGDGLLTSEGDRWKGQRRTLQPLFTRQRIADYTDAFLTATEVVGDGWEGRDRVELVAEMEKVTLGSVSRALFGTDATAEVAPIVAATDELSRITVRRGLAPVSVPRWAPTPGVRRLRRLESDLWRRTARIVEAAASGEGRDDLVARLRDARDPRTGEGFDERAVLEQALVFLLAGYDTTSTALTFTLHELGARPDLQTAVRAEVRDVVGERAPTPDDVARLELTRRCLLEAMRLHPPAYITSRTVTDDTVAAGYDLPAGTVVATIFSALHRNGTYWPDPERFDPDRFLPDAVAERDRYAYLPFGGGPRSCIGEHFAILEAVLALAVLLRRFEVTTDAASVPMRYGITQRADASVFAGIRPAVAASRTT